jgi:hypothetical protein
MGVTRTMMAATVPQSDVANLFERSKGRIDSSPHQIVEWASVRLGPPSSCHFRVTQGCLDFRQTWVPAMCNSDGSQLANGLMKTSIGNTVVVHVTANPGIIDPNAAGQMQSKEPVVVHSAGIVEIEQADTPETVHANKHCRMIESRHPTTYDALVMRVAGVFVDRPIVFVKNQVSIHEIATGPLQRLNRTRELVRREPVVRMDELQISSARQGHAFVEGIANASIRFADPVVLRGETPGKQVLRPVARGAIYNDVLEISECLMLYAFDRARKGRTGVPRYRDNADRRRSAQNCRGATTMCILPISVKSGRCDHVSLMHSGRPLLLQFAAAFRSPQQACTCDSRRPEGPRERCA